MNLAWLSPEKPQKVAARFNFDGCVSSFAQVGSNFLLCLVQLKLES